MDIFRRNRSGAGYLARTPRQRRPRARSMLAAVVAATALGAATLGAIRPVGAHVAGSPFGALDQVRAVAGPAVVVAGWAADPDAASPTAVHIYADGMGVAATIADRPRTDLVAVVGGAGHGFEAVIPAVRGHHDVCAYAIDLPGTPGENALLGCRSINVTGTPVGRLDVATDTPAPSLTDAAPTQVGGWALDPDADAAIEVHLYMDDAFASAISAGSPRPDVAAAFSGYGPDHGFDTTLAVPYGVHEVCAYALNLAGTDGDPALLGCATVTSASGTPFGSVDLVARTSTGVDVAGWVIDPASAVFTSTARGTPYWGTGPLETIELWVDARPQVTMTANVDRADVLSITQSAPFAALYRQNPAPRYGFATTVPLTAGPHVLCVVAEHHPWSARVDASTVVPVGAIIGCARV